MSVPHYFRIAGINTRTLHYYDDIGLFSPETKDKNGYRYYTLEQVVDLGIILSLKELDMPLKEIKSVLYSDMQTSREALERKKAEVDQKIESLTEVRQVIERKLHFLDLAENQSMELSLIDMEEEYLILSKKIQEATSQDLIENGYDLLVKEGKHFFANNEYGSMIHNTNKNTEAYDYFYIKTNKKEDNTFIKPAGRYLNYIHKGDDAGLKDAYAMIKVYLKKNNFTPEGYYYERALNETIHTNLKEYVTEIQIKVN